MDYETAIESEVSQSEAIAEIRRHGVSVSAVCRDGFESVLICADTGEVICFPNSEGMYSGKTILDWLGY